MVQLAEIKKARKEKLDLLKKSGVNPYPLETKRTHLISKALKDFSKLEKSKKEIILAGRLRSFRIHGGATFAEIEDGTGKIQIFFKKDHLGVKKYEWFLKYLDIGDFVEARGELFKTKRKEKTLLIANVKILAKSILPLPEKWHGLKDVEERFRKRYLDLIMNKKAKERFLLRFQIIQELRNFLISNDFLETETPILHTIYGGAKAEPFKTHFNALDLDVYLRIATEIHLKELIVGGFEKVFEIGRIFRNEGIDKHHNPEFTSLEFYWAYADYKDLMKFCEQMIAFILKKVFGKLEIEYEGKKINFKGPFKRVEFYELLRKDADIDLENIHPDKLAQEAKKMGIKIEPGEGTAEIADRIYKKCSRDKIIQPTFIIHHPIGAFPLAKPHPTLEGRLANFQLVAGGTELVNAFSELNDPIKQREIFKEQEKMYKQGYKEAQRTDENFLQALEHGMPPTAGFGMGLDRLVALLTDSHSLREVILFPTMRPKN